ncbi:MAG TPA: transglutaminase-like domain-containing protein [Pyrinomonadaceae bacterium]|jgi:regulator of sirC expression with transglutaminase-like and TPR domain
MTPADKLAAEEVRRRFAAEVARPESEIDLGRAALLLGAEEEPRRAAVERSLARLDEMGEAVRARAVGRGVSLIDALSRYLFDELGFVGNEADYYDPRNSMLHHVLERHTGIPITLSVVYMEVGRRAGLEVEGLGLPGHFIVRAREGQGEWVLIDPFNGRQTDRDECQSRLDLIYEGKISLEDAHLRPVGARTILVRMLGNLKAVYARAQLYRRALAAVERILLLTPQDLQERRDRGMLLAQLGRLPEAIAETQLYLNLTPEAGDADSVREQLNRMRGKAALLN